MIKIFNLILQKEISIDEQHPAVTIMPKPYDEDYPSILIELRDIDFVRHASSCEDCCPFYNAFGSSTVDWFIEWQGKTYRLDLSKLGTDIDQNLIQHKIGAYFSGTRLKLLLSTETVENLENELQSSISSENYEHCAFLRDRIKSLK